jgi:hypothetical protein
LATLLLESSIVPLFPKEPFDELPKEQETIGFLMNRPAAAGGQSWLDIIEFQSWETHLSIIFRYVYNIVTSPIDGKFWYCTPFEPPLNA